MARVNPPFVKFNAGLISPKALARVDDPRVALSAETMTNWLPKTQGNMRIRPGTKYFGSSLNDTGAYFIEFVAATDELALLELTNGKMRVWQGSDAHTLSLLGRPLVSTTVSLSDTGWSEDHLGGGITASNAPADGVNELPTFTDSGPVEGVSITGTNSTSEPWKISDGNPGVWWITSFGSGDSGLLTVDFGAGQTRKIKSFTLTAPDSINSIYTPSEGTLQGSNNASAWTSEIKIGPGLSWGFGETKTFEDTGYTDTGGNAWRYWRLKCEDNLGASRIMIGEMELLSAGDTGQAVFAGGAVTLNAGANGSLARIRKAVVLSDTGDINVEHSLAVRVTRGPVTIRVGASEGSDDLISETDLATGYHNLAFIPGASPFHITLQTDETVDRVVGSLSIGDSGTVELTAPWSSSDLDNIRFDQSADVVFVAAKNVQQHRIERRGTGSSKGRSWSVVEYLPDFGPFLAGAGQAARLSLNQRYGNVELKSDIPVFQADHSGALFRLTHTGQSGIERLGNKDAVTEAVTVTGIGDTGKSSDNERRIVFAISGTYSGTVTIERSFDAAEFGFHTVITNNITTGSASDTGTFSATIDDPDDNATVWYRARMTNYTSGTATVTYTARSSVKSTVVRATGFNNNQSMNVEVLRRPSDTGSTYDWQEGSWSDHRGFPSAIALHEGRLAHAGIASVWLSVSDDYNNFDDEIEGDAGPIARTFGSGPVENILYLVSMNQLVSGTADAEIVIRSSSFDEVLTPSNSAARRISSLGSSNVRPAKRDSDIFFVQRSKQRVYNLTLSGGSQYEIRDLTVLVPELLGAGVVSIAIQRQPDTRLHCVLEDGTVAILTFEPDEETIAWCLWRTDTGTSGTVERAMVLPGAKEDAVYYHIRRTINGATKRFLEKWALESESEGDTGLSYLADCAISFTSDTGDLRDTAFTGAQHLAGASVVVWADDTGQTNAGKDLSPDVSGGQMEYSVGTGGATDTGEITLGEAVHHAVAGLPYKADWKSTKLAYGAEAGTALAQFKRVGKLALLLSQTHNNGLFMGNDTGKLDPLPRKSDRGALVDADKIFTAKDLPAVPFPGRWDPDARIFLRAKSPRPATVLAAVPSVETQEKR